jgi:hypothetical protein
MRRVGRAERAGRPSKAAIATPLNVVIVTLDTTRADALGAYDATHKTSPNLDRLARLSACCAARSNFHPTTRPCDSS